MSFRRTVLLVFLFVMGCSAKLIPYQPQEFDDVSKTMGVLEETLSYQSPKHAVKILEINPEFIKIVSGARYTTSYIHFKDIKKFDLYEKRGRKIVFIKGNNNRLLYRLYVEDEAVATDFINAVYTLKKHPKEIELELKKPSKKIKDTSKLDKKTDKLDKKEKNK